MNDRNLKFRGEVLSIEKTAETRKDEHGETWSNCIFTVKLTDSNSVTKETVGRQWIGKTDQTQTVVLLSVALQDTCPHHNR